MLARRTAGPVNLLSSRILPISASSRDRCSFVKPAAVRAKSLGVAKRVGSGHDNPAPRPRRHPHRGVNGDRGSPDAGPDFCDLVVRVLVKVALTKRGVKGGRP